MEKVSNRRERIVMGDYNARVGMMVHRLSVDGTLTCAQSTSFKILVAFLITNTHGNKKSEN